VKGIFNKLLGRSEEALAVAKRALDLDPASPAVSHSLAVQLYLARKFDRATEQAHDTLEMDANFAISYAVLGEVYLSQGMYREGLLTLEKYSALSRSSATSLALLGYSHARLGELKEALQKIEELKAASTQGFVPAFSLRWFMPGWKIRIRPSRGSKRLTRSGSIVSPT
jgi:tetratricopeptide (TPR) repeat protein